MDLAFEKQDSPLILQEFVNRMFFGLNTSIPGTIQEFDSLTQEAVVTPNIRQIENKSDGTTSTVQMPDLIRVPCIFNYSTTTGFALTFPVRKGDQCLLLFAQRSIDNWQEHGFVQDPVEKKYPRAHSISDAMAIVGLIPKPSAIKDFQNDKIEIRNIDRSVHVSVSQTEVNAKSGTQSLQITPLSIILKGNVVIDGTLSGLGSTPVQTIAGINHSGKTIDANHTHSGVSAGSDDSGGVS